MTKTKTVAGKAPCGFCTTGHHDLCPETVRNGSQAPNPIWTCPCSVADHALGGPHRTSNVTRINPASMGPRVAPRPVADVVLPPAPSDDPDDLGHVCIVASCLAHRRRVWIGGDSRVWRHQDNYPCQPAPETATPRRRTSTRTSTPAGAFAFPDGVISPVSFRHLLVAKGLAPESFIKQTVYTWVKQAERGRSDFPCRWYTADGVEHDQPVDGSKPGVPVEAGVDWYKGQQAA